MQESCDYPDYNGVAAISDMDSPEWHELTKVIEAGQAAFLEKETLFRSPAYKWPLDPLHTWSRVWEYPYAYSHIRKYLRNHENAASVRVVDVGSGVTFFPFTVARLGCHVTCTDIDQVCEVDIAKAAKEVNHTPGAVEFRLIHGHEIPFGNGEVDIIYCISVLEHIPRFEKTVEEMARVLKPGGMLILTIDLDLRGDYELGVEERRVLCEQLLRHFDEALPQRVMHPADIITTDKSPYPLPGQHRGLGYPWFVLKRLVLKYLLGRKLPSLKQPLLAVEGMVLVKK